MPYRPNDLRWIGKAVVELRFNPYTGGHQKTEGVIVMVAPGCVYHKENCGGPTITVRFFTTKEAAKLCGSQHLARTQQGYRVKPGVE